MFFNECMHGHFAQQQTRDTMRSACRLGRMALRWALLQGVALLPIQAAPAAARYDAFHPGQPWLDVTGNEIDAHGAGLLTVGAETFWFGTKRHGHPNVAPPHTYPPYSAYCYPLPPDSSDEATSARARARDGYTEGVNAYVSDGDLYNWKPLGLVFPANVTGAHCLERPKVVQCPGTKRFVLWAKGFRPMPMNDKLAVVATSDSPAGPFTLVDHGGPDAPFYAPGGDELADATVYVDEAGRGAWLYWRSKGQVGAENQTSGFMVGKLSADCTRLEGEPTRIASVFHEAPAVFQSGGKLFIWTSSTTGNRAVFYLQINLSTMWPCHCLLSESNNIIPQFVVGKLNMRSRSPFPRQPLQLD
eukprot:COSAG06_NODE_820_length_12102_cov_16.846205_5_plen_359_part_00